LLSELARVDARTFASQPLPGWRLHKLRTAENEQRAYGHVAEAVIQLKKDFALNEMAIVSFGGVGQRKRVLEALKLFNVPVTNELHQQDAIMLYHPRTLKGHEKKAVVVLMPPINKEQWIAMFQELGLNETAMHRWHRISESRHPEAHPSFLEWLGLGAEEASHVRQNSR
jgi:hypothetical protein